MTIAPNLSSPRSQSAVPTVALNGRWMPKDSAGSLGVETGWPAGHPRLALEDLDIGAGVVVVEASRRQRERLPQSLGASLPQASAATIHSKLPANRHVPGPRADSPNEFADGCRALVVL
jgi:hypothetical protein